MLLLTLEAGDRGEIFESLAEVGTSTSGVYPTVHGAADQQPIRSHINRASAAEFTLVWRKRDDNVNSGPREDLG